MTKQEFEKSQSMSMRKNFGRVCLEASKATRGRKVVITPCATKEEYDLYISEVAEDVRDEYLDMYDNSVDEIVTDISWGILDSQADKEEQEVIEYLDSKGYKTNEQKVYKLAEDILAQV